MDLAALLPTLRELRDLQGLVAALGHEPQWTRAGVGLVVVGRQGDFPWLGLEAPEGERKARALARSWARRGRPAGVLALDRARRRLTVAVAFGEVPAVTIDLAEPAAVALRCLRRLAGRQVSALAYALRAADALQGEAVGRRFFHEFRAALETMAERAPAPLRGEDRRAFALLQLTRVLFLYFVQAKGWLGGRERFLAEEVDRCLARRRQLHRDLLRPLFFGTLNRAPAERSRASAQLGPIPFLNGGLFEPHPLERGLRADVPNDVWRESFDRLFERFHFTVAEGEPDGRVAPDMLGRVFEGVMAPDARRASGTYYTPATLVHRLVRAALVGLLAHRTGCTEQQAERLLAEAAPRVWPAIGDALILDPAVGSGAFLLGALEHLAALAPGGDTTAVRRAILQRNLFGVDRSAGAVRLAELRLWLAVIARDPTDRPDLVHPLPNLDCLIRQGDSLFDPPGAAGHRGGNSDLAAALANTRRRVVMATGAEKRAALRRLAVLELQVSAAALAAAEREHAESADECLREARAADLFGGRRGLDAALRHRLAHSRRELHAVRRARRTLARTGEVPWFHYGWHFADVLARGGFDLVIGNPPWLRSEVLPEAERRRLAERYRWWVSGGRGYANRPDLAVAFLERSLELAAPDGVIALLVPAKVATAGYGACARHALAAGTTLLRVADLSRAGAAFDATVYPLAVVARKTRPPPRHRIATGLEPGAPSVPQARLQGGTPWVLSREPLRDALQVLAKEHPRLDSLLACHLGLKTGANRIFLDPPDDIERELIREAVRGRDIRPFRAAGGRRLLYTHGPGGGPLTGLPPRAGEYLARCREELVARADYAGGPAWTLFRTGPATAAHRVVWSDLARRLTAAALVGRRDERLVPLNTCYVAPTRSAAEAERVAAWLNATWLRAAARAGAVPAAGGFARFSATVVGALPLPPAVLGCQALPGLAAAARRGEPVQDDLDELTARYLDLPARARSALRRFLGGNAQDRR